MFRGTSETPRLMLKYSLESKGNFSVKFDNLKKYIYTDNFQKSKFPFTLISFLLKFGVGEVRFS